MDEFKSEEPLPAETAAERDSQQERHDRSRDEWAFRIVTAIAIVEAAILIVAGISLSGVFGIPTGTLIVDSVPAAAEVRIDGVLAGITPLSVSAETGHRVLEVRQQPNVRTITVNVARGETPHSLVVFAAPTSIAPASTEVPIGNAPAAAQIPIDGVERGERPLGVPDLAPGALQTPAR